MLPRPRALLPPPAARSGFHAGSADVPRTRRRRGGEEEERARGAAGRDPAALWGRGEGSRAGRGLPALRSRGVTAGPNAGGWGRPAYGAVQTQPCQKPAITTRDIHQGKWERLLCIPRARPPSPPLSTPVRNGTVRLPQKPEARGRFCAGAG